MTHKEVVEFITPFRMLMLATVGTNGRPYASTAPFIRKEDRFYVFVSTVAQHGRNLLHTEHASILFAADEGDTVQPFARKRLTAEVSVQEIIRDTRLFQEILALFSDTFDRELIEQLEKMRDFHLFELMPESASMVIGFGKAYALNGFLEPITTINRPHEMRDSSE